MNSAESLENAREDELIVEPADPKELISYWLCDSVRDPLAPRMPNYETIVEPETVLFLQTGHGSYTPLRKSGLEPGSNQAILAAFNSPAKVNQRVKRWLRRAA